MRHIVSYSTGLSSSLAAVRVAERYGADHTLLVFMDTHFEDEDNYRFMREFVYKTGLEILYLSEGRTPYQVSHAEHVIPNSRVAPCTHRLKIEPFRAWLKTQSELITIHIGYDFSEMHRCEPTRKNYESLGYAVDFPLLWKPYEFRSYEIISREDWGIEPPRMYKLGYTHANCGGRCVKQGHGDWLRTLVNFPERYAEIERWEREMRLNPVNADYAILKRQTKEGVTALTLEELRLEYERNDIGKMSLFDMDEKSSCVVCGIGG